MLRNASGDEHAAGSAAEVFRVFLKLGCTSFGGPVAHLGYFHKEFVERRQWLKDSQYSQLLAICQFLPGPASSQLGFSIGLARAGWPGAIAAFIAFTLPSAVLLILLAALLPELSGSTGQAGLRGLKIVALAVVADAVLGMSKKLCPDLPRATIALAAASALVVLAGAWAQLVVVVAGAVAGVLFCRQLESQQVDALPVHHGRALAGVLLIVFAALLIGLPLLASMASPLLSVADAFYRAGALVFGGGHVVLPLLEETVVASGWLDEETFLAGYGAAQAIPGPMFAFAAYLGAMIPTALPPVLGAAVALLFMFLPGFLLVAGVLPYWRAVSANATASRAIAGVNAAVVGLLGAALYDPIYSAAIVSPQDMAIAIVAFTLLRVWHCSALAVVLWCILASIVGAHV